MATTPSFFSKTIDYKRSTACWIACPISTINKAISDNIPSNAVVDTLKLNVEADFGHVLANAYIQYGWGGETSINKHLLNSSGEDTKLTSTDPRWYPENGVDIKGYLNSDKRTLSTANGNYLSFRFYSTNLFLEEYRVTEINLDITYSIPTYTVTWKNHDGTVLETDTGVESGTTPTFNGSTPKKTGYTFSGWSPAVGAISGNTTYTAQFTENKYTIAFNGNGNTGGSMSSMTNIGYDDSKTLTANAFTKTGYTFAGWATSASGSVVHSDKASVSKLSSANGATVTLYAKWTANSYTIKFNANGGSGSMSDLAMTYGTAKNLTANSFTRTGYDFLGWSTSSTATTATYADKASVNNLATSGTVTLYAVWKIKTFTVTWKNADGTTLETDTGVAYGTTPTYNGSTPTKAYDSSYHYTFKGWDKTVGAITGNTTYTATYNSVDHSYTSKETTAATCTAAGVRTYTCSCGRSYTESIPALGHSYTDVVTQPTETANGYTTHTCKNDSSHSYVDTYTCLATFKNYDGSVLKTEKVNQGGKPTAPTNPTRTGYKFIGWSPAVGAINNSTVFTAVYEKLPPQITTVTITRSSDLANVSISAPVDAGAKFIISVEVT